MLPIFEVGRSCGSWDSALQLHGLGGCPSEQFCFEFKPWGVLSTKTTATYMSLSYSELKHSNDTAEALFLGSETVRDGSSPLDTRCCFVMLHLHISVPLGQVSQKSLSVAVDDACF